MKKILLTILISLCLSLSALALDYGDDIFIAVESGGGNETEILVPDGDISTTNWNYSTTGYYQDVADDSDATEVDTVYNDQVLIFTLQDTSASSGKTIVSVEFKARFNDTNLTSPWIYYNPNGAGQQLAVVGPVTSSYAEYTTGPLTENPATSSAWTSAIIDGIFVGARAANTTNATHLAKIWAVVTYEP